MRQLRRRIAQLLAVAPMLLFTPTAGAQRVPANRWRAASLTGIDSIASGDSTRAARTAAEISPGAPAIARRVDPAIVRAVAPGLSAIAPGSGQFLLHEDRFVAYLAVETYGWLSYVKDVRDQAQQEGAFKQIALDVARAHFCTSCPDGGWSYYEAMRDWLQSGRYTTASDGSVVPETDPSTFNGNQWQIELSTHPDSASALAAYARDAIKPQFAWSWQNAQLQYDIFKRTTNKRNDAYSAGIQDLFLLAANHVLSLVDAFATMRLQVRAEAGVTAGGGAGRTLSIGATVPW
jgi:hypothetical protein